MFYVSKYPNSIGNHGNPQSNQYADSVALPAELLTDYIACRGFAVLAVEDGTVTAVEENMDALNAYLAEHPDVPDEPFDEPSAQDDTDAMLIDHELRLTLLELGM